MSSFIRAVPVYFPLARSAPIAAMIGAAILASPIAPAHAEGLKAGPMTMAQAATPKPPVVAPVVAEKPETVEARIADLRAKLQITAAEDGKWNAVAKAMRENAAAMEKLVADKKAQTPQGMTAIDDLMTYQKFAQAHLDGLKNLTAAFKTLYNAMPAEQKLVADQAFMQYGRGTPPTRG
jgi:protein CpxP